MFWEKLKKHPLNIKCPVFAPFFLFGLLLGPSYWCNGSKHGVVDARAFLEVSSPSQSFLISLKLGGGP